MASTRNEPHFNSWSELRMMVFRSCLEVVSHRTDSKLFLGAALSRKILNKIHKLSHTKPDYSSNCTLLLTRPNAMD